MWMPLLETSVCAVCVSVCVVLGEAFCFYLYEKELDVSVSLLCICVLRGPHL